MWLTSSSVGRKLIMSVTGAFLVLFLTFHALMNGVALFWPTAYNVVCEFLGANWYALIASAVLAAGFILHILYALWLTIQNRRARGSERYAVTSRPPQVEWSSKNMLVLGIVVLAFLVLHLVQFWAKMQLAEICPAVGATTIDINGVETVANPAAGTLFLQLAFSCWITLACYVIGLVALWFHLTHGFWSMFQTCGWNGKTWLPRLKTIGNWWVTIVVGLFLAQAIVFTVQANRGYYTSNECLLEQYAEMDAAHGAAIIPCATEAACDQAACPNATCPNAAGCTEAACGQAANCGNPGCSTPSCDPATCVPAQGCCSGQVVAVEETVTESSNN